MQPVMPETQVKVAGAGAARLYLSRVVAAVALAVVAAPVERVVAAAVRVSPY